MDLEIREPRTAQDFDLYYALRWRILREPWTQSRESGKDEHELDGIHLMAWRGEDLLGVGRVHLTSAEEGQIRYMAVEQRFSGQGVGSCILQQLEKRATAVGARRMVLNARVDAVPFYRKHGYRLVDQSSTLFNSIVHWWMRKDLP